MDSPFQPTPPESCAPVRTAPLRRFVLAALSLIIIVWSVAQFGALSLLVERSYLELEAQDGLKNARRLDGLMTREYERLLQMVRDYGYWDDTHAFVRGEKPDYIEANLADSAFANLAVDVVLLGKPDGRLLFLGRSSTSPPADSADADTLFQTLLASDKGRELLASSREIKGLIGTAQGLLAFAAVPILNNDRSVAPAGLILFGRLVNGGLLDAARAYSAIDAEVFVPGKAPWPPDIARLWDARGQSPLRSSHPLSAERLGAYLMLADYEGQPVGILRSVTSRDTKQRLEAIARYLLGISVLLAALLTLAAIWVLERRVLSPLAAVSRVVNAVAREGGLELRVPESSRRDELAQLGREINRMLGELASQQGLRDARDHALAAAAQKSEFLANMSHEIRTPMNGILGMLELVLETELTAQQQERVQTAYRSAEGLLALLNDILDFSKLEAGKLSLEQRAFDLRELVETVVTLFAPNCEHKGIAISCFVQPGLGDYIGDPLRVRQVLSNLVGNAVKFTAQGEVTIDVTAPAPDRLRIVVADTGVGIPPEHLTQLFQPFSQLDASMARRFGGTGLGLAICRQLVERMHGKLDVASVPGNGTRFECILMLPPAASSSEPRAMPHAGRQALVLGPLDGTRGALVGYLGALGFEVRCLPQTADISLSTATKPDLLVIDETLTGAAISSLYAQAASADVPTLRLARFNHSAAARAQFAERMPAISKPVLFDKLCRSVEQALRPANESRQAMPVRQAQPPRLKSLAGKRLLLVEDNLVNQALALGMLETYDLVVDCAESGCEALEKLATARYDLVLMDCQMPEMDGLEATRRWRLIEADQRKPRLPVIALTANAMVGDREACLASGMDDYLAKPFTRARLSEILLSWLCPHEAHQAASDKEPLVAASLV